MLPQNGSELVAVTWWQNSLSLPLFPSTVDLLLGATSTKHWLLSSRNIQTFYLNPSGNASTTQGSQEAKNIQIHELSGKCILKPQHRAGGGSAGKGAWCQSPDTTVEGGNDDWVLALWPPHAHLATCMPALACMSHTYNDLKKYF